MALDDGVEDAGPDEAGPDEAGPEGAGLPLVSVLMPVRNEAQLIGPCLRAVLAQDYPAERLEILVVDGQSTDPTVDVIRALPGAERVKILANPRRIQAAALNLGLREARGEIIVRLDAHAIVEPDYIRQCVRALARTGAQNVGGSIRPVGSDPKTRAIASASRSQFAVPGAFHLELPKDAPGRYTDTVYMGAWPRDVLLSLGGFNEQLAVNEDYELNHRIRQAGGRVYFSPAIRSRYCPRERYRLLAKQYFRYGRGKMTAVRMSPGSLRWRQLAPPAFVAALALGGSLLAVSLATWGLAAAFSLAALGALGAVLLAYGALAVRCARTTVRQFPVGERSTLLRTMLVFPLMHLAWGVGFWTGLILPQAPVPKRLPKRRPARARQAGAPGRELGREPVGIKPLAKPLVPDT